MKTMNFSFLRSRARIRTALIAIAMTLILGLTFTTAHAGQFWSSLLTGDADSGVFSAKTYTHAYTFGPTATDVNVNGVTFTGITSPTPSGSNFSTLGFAAQFGAIPTNVTGDMNSIVNDFVYGVVDAATDPTQTLILNDLVVGQKYVTTFYNLSFGYTGGRQLTINTSDGTEFEFDQNFSSQDTPESIGYYGNKLWYAFTATDTSQSFVFTPEVPGDSFHLYGFSNEEAGNGSFSTSTFTGDADCGISATKNYTHAYNMDMNEDSGDITINDVTFTAADIAVGASDFSASGFTGFVNLPPSSNISGSIGELTSSFNYNDGSVPETLTLTDLEIGKEYKTTLYNMTWGDEGGRLLQVSTSQGDSFIFDENLGGSGEANGNGKGNMLTYSFTAIDTEVSLSLSPVSGSLDSFHFYGFSNEELASVPEPSCLALLIATLPLGLLRRKFFS